MVGVMYVLGLSVNFLLVSALEDEGHAVMFQDRKVLIHSKGDNQDATVKLGVKEGKMYRLLGQPIDRSKGILDMDRCQR